MDRALLFMASVFLATSGALKARSAGKHGLGTPILPLVELAAAVAVAALATLVSAPATMGFAVIVASVVLVIGSSVQHWRKLSDLHRERERSEGSRLADYVRYLSGPPKDSE